jgi:hypothetical protein
MDKKLLRKAMIVWAQKVMILVFLVRMFVCFSQLVHLFQFGNFETLLKLSTQAQNSILSCAIQTIYK